MTMLSQAWATVADNILPPDTPPDQRLEARRLFYSGAYCLAQLQLATTTLSAADRADMEQTINVELQLWASTMGTALEGMV
jgi:hypothetical protein